MPEYQELENKCIQHSGYLCLCMCMYACCKEMVGVSCFSWEGSNRKVRGGENWIGIEDPPKRIGYAMSFFKIAFHLENGGKCYLTELLRKFL